MREEFVNNLRLNALSFSFKKSDGTIRQATGTLNFDLIPKEFHPKVELDENNEPVVKARKENPDVQTFFDLDKLSWRSFRWDSLITDAQ